MGMRRGAEAGFLLFYEFPGKALTRGLQGIILYSTGREL